MDFSACARYGAQASLDGMTPKGSRASSLIPNFLAFARRLHLSLLKKSILGIENSNDVCYTLTKVVQQHETVAYRVHLNL
jgi:hypothetical protein